MHKTSRQFLRTSGFYTQPLVFKSPKNICLYIIFDWLSVSFRYTIKLRDNLMFSIFVFQTEDCLVVA